MNLFLFTQQTVQPNQPTFNFGQANPFELGGTDIAQFVFRAIQHANYSIKCIAESTLSGRNLALEQGVRRMSYMLCYRLIPLSIGIVSHGFEESTNRFLVPWRDASVLLDHNILRLAERVMAKSRSHAVENVRDVETDLTCCFAQIRRRRIARPRLIVCLGPLGNTERISNLALRHAVSLPFFLQPGAYIFRKMQNYSSALFTNASKCIIVHSTPHETARNCTMPNTCITEQARKQAREALEKRGQSAKDFAELHNLNPSTVYAVLSGQSRCRRGEAHRAAVLLGIKDGVIEQ